MFVQLLNILGGALFLFGNRCLHSCLCLRLFGLFWLDRIWLLCARLIIVFCLIVFCLIFVGLTAGSSPFIGCGLLFLSFQLGISLLLGFGDALTPFDWLLRCFVFRDTVGCCFCASIFACLILFTFGIFFSRSLLHFILNLYFKFR